jgi:hypothetical protein
MSQRILLMWAVLATVIAVAMTGFVVGKSVGIRSASSDEARAATEMPYSTQPSGADEALPAFAMPDMFAGAPREWRSAVNKGVDGYVVLFDAEAREIIVEKCQHAGYPSDANSPIMDQEFCTGVLSGWLAALTETEAIVQDRARGSNVTVRLKARLAGDKPTLRLRFADHDAALVPGTKNEWLQAVERQPSIVEQKKRYLLALGGERPSRADEAEGADRND